MNRHLVDIGLNLGLRWKNLNPKYKENIPVTVCVAALCDGKSNVVGASDRMLTTGDGSVQFEPLQSKIINITTSIVFQWAGDSPLQSEIITRAKQEVADRVAIEPDNWWKVEDVAHVCQRYFIETKARRASIAYLSPIGLDTKSFVSRNQELQPGLASQLATELISYACPPIEIIIAGVDKTGAHIFVVNNSGLYCMDSPGFAAIGIGASHANAQYMFSRYSPDAELPDVLFLSYTAKRRGEVASGVGSETDLFFVVGLGGRRDINESIHDKLKSSYGVLVKTEEMAYETARQDYYEFVEEIISQATPRIEQQETESNDDNGSTSVDETGLSDSAPES